MWDWSSPVAWAVFLCGVGVSVLLMGLGLRYLSTAVANFMALNKKR
jgi:hypothetical protein